METLTPRFVYRVPPPAVNLGQLEAVAALEHLHFAEPRGLWRQLHINTHDQPPRTEPMPAPARPRRRRQAGYAEAFDAKIVALAAEGFIVRPLANGMLRWRVACAQKPEVGQIHVYLQPPSTAGLWLIRLWRCGMRIDGFDFTERGAVLHTIIRHQDQMVVVQGMVRWLTGYVAAAPMVGMPPPPYQLVASHSLVERIRANDAVSPVLGN